MKTGHDKRNQGDIIIRHNYVAVAGVEGKVMAGLGGGGGMTSCFKIANKERDTKEENTACFAKVCLIDQIMDHVTLIMGRSERYKLQILT